jgi:hypothetical protein
LPELPVHSREAVEQEPATLDFLEMQIESAAERLEKIMKVTVEAHLLKTLPCVGTILSMVRMLEIGTVERFPTAAHLASYAGLVPRVHSSGGHTRMGQVCGSVVRNLKWAFVETGNLIVINQRGLTGTHVVGSITRGATLSEDLMHQESSEGSAAAFSSWMGLCPDNDVGGGKILWTGTRKVKNRLAAALQSLQGSQSALGEFYRRMRAKLGAQKALTATAHKLARIIYHMLKTRESYDESVFVRLEIHYRQRLENRLKHRLMLSDSASFLHLLLRERKSSLGTEPYPPLRPFVVYPQE